MSDKFERWNNRLKEESPDRGLSKPVQKSSKIVQNTTYPRLQAAYIAPRRNLFACGLEDAWLRCMHMCLPNEPESWAQIARDNTTDLKQRTMKQTYPYRGAYEESKGPNLAIFNKTHVTAQVEPAPIVSFFARLQPSTLEFYILSPYETTI